MFEADLMGSREERDEVASLLRLSSKNALANHLITLSDRASIFRWDHEAIESAVVQLE